MFFQLQHNATHWYNDEEGHKLCTLLKKGNPIVENFRKWGLQRGGLPKRVLIFWRGGYVLGC